MAQAFLKTPMAGKQGNEFIIVNYVDWKVAGIGDYHCGTKTYNGHQGTDFTLRSFNQMDSGVNVLAAAAGEVVAIKDGEFDRETDGDVSKLLGNYIAIKHANLYYTYYGHLKKNSLLVKVGDMVSQGQAIAQIGSSGNSTDPHLHFELWYDSITVVDPFGNGGCGNASSLWLDEVPYDSSFMVLDGGVVDKNLSLNLLRERPVAKPAVFDQNGNEDLNIWGLLHGVRQNDSLELVWEKPDGSVWFVYNFKIQNTAWYYYYWSYISHIDLDPGVWKAKLFVNNTLKAQYPFTISAVNGTKRVQKTNTDLARLPIADLQQIYGTKLNVHNMAGKKVMVKAGQVSPGIYIISVPINGEVHQAKRAIF